MNEWLTSPGSQPPAPASDFPRSLAPPPAATSGIPGYLVAQPRWLLWRAETKINRNTGEKRTTKVPISYHTGKACEVTAPASWTDYDKAEGALARTPGAWDGPGFRHGVIEALDWHVPSQESSRFSSAITPAEVVPVPAEPAIPENVGGLAYGVRRTFGGT